MTVDVTCAGMGISDMGGPAFDMGKEIAGQSALHYNEILNLKWRGSFFGRPPHTHQP
jgi:hypothetical protein